MQTLELIKSMPGDKDITFSECTQKVTNNVILEGLI